MLAAVARIPGKHEIPESNRQYTHSVPLATGQACPLEQLQPLDDGES